MAVAATNLTSKFSDNGSFTSIVTASISPSANNLILASVTSRRGDGANPSVPSLSGNGLTWVQVATIIWDTTSASRRTLTVFRAMGSSPSAGALTASWGAEVQTDICISVTQYSGVDTSGTNGSGAIVQSATNKDETGTATSLTITLGAFGSVNNATFGALADGNGASETASAGTGFTMKGSAQCVVSDALSVYDEFRSDNDTTVNFTWTTGINAGGIACEIKAAVTTVVKDLIGGFIPFAR